MLKILSSDEIMCIKYMVLGEEKRKVKYRIGENEEEIDLVFNKKQQQFCEV